MALMRVPNWKWNLALNLPQQLDFWQLPWRFELCSLSFPRFPHCSPPRD